MLNLWLPARITSEDEINLRCERAAAIVDENFRLHLMRVQELKRGTLAAKQRRDKGTQGAYVSRRFDSSIGARLSDSGRNLSL